MGGTKSSGENKLTEESIREDIVKPRAKREPIVKPQGEPIVRPRSAAIDPTDPWPFPGEPIVKP